MGFGVGLSILGALHLGRQLTSTPQQLLLLLALRLRDLFTERLLLRPQLLERRDSRAPCLIRREDLVDQVRRGAAPALRLAGQLGVVAEDAQINHPVRVSSQVAAVRLEFFGRVTK